MSRNAEKIFNGITHIDDDLIVETEKYQVSETPPGHCFWKIVHTKNIRKLAFTFAIVACVTIIFYVAKYSLQGTTQGRYLTGGVPPVRFSM